LSESIEWPRPSSSGSPRRRYFLVVLAVLVILVFCSRTAISYWVDLLWFRSLGYADVFWKTFWLEWSAFALFGVVTFLYLFGVFAAFKRVHGANLPEDHTIFIAGNPIKLPVAQSFAGSPPASPCSSPLPRLPPCRRNGIPSLSTGIPRPRSRLTWKLSRPDLRQAA